MAVELVVKEQFGFNGTDYPRGSVISDPALVASVKDAFPKHHFIQREAVAPLNAAPKRAPDPISQSADLAPVTPKN